MFDPPVYVRVNNYAEYGESSEESERSTRSPFEYDLVGIFLQISVLNVFIIDSIRNICVMILQLNLYVYHMRGQMLFCGLGGNC
jgi:hypothetical protein